MSDVNGDVNAGHQRGAAWNRPLNGGASETGSVMGGDVSWPALSKSTPTVVQSPSDLCASSSGGSASSSQAPLISHPPRQRQVSDVATASNTIRPRSRGRGGGGSRGSRGNAQGIGPSHHVYNQPYPSYQIHDVPHAMFSHMEHPVTSNRPVGGVGASPSQRNTPRRGNYGPRPRGNDNHGGRRGQGRRDVHHFQSQYLSHHPPMGYMPPPPPPPLPTGASHYMAPAPGYGRPFLGPMGFEMGSPLFLFPPPIESYRGMPIVPQPQPLPPPPPPPPMNLDPATDNDLTNRIVRQIDYYFSDYNLSQDGFLRSRMDSRGWVSIGLVASFRRMQSLTTDISTIRDALRYSLVVEVQDDMVRRRNGWERWIQPVLGVVYGNNVAMGIVSPNGNTALGFPANGNNIDEDSDSDTV